jgi:hypothetical protein
MTEPSAPPDQPPSTIPGTDQGISISIALLISVVSAILVAACSYGVVRGHYATGLTRVLAVVVLLAFVAMIYGLLQLSLAVIATSAERRRRAREVTERRQGDRARKKKG